MVQGYDFWLYYMTEICVPAIKKGNCSAGSDWLRLADPTLYDFIFEGDLGEFFSPGSQPFFIWFTPYLLAGFFSILRVNTVSSQEAAVLLNTTLDAVDSIIDPYWLLEDGLSSLFSNPEMVTGLVVLVKKIILPQLLGYGTGLPLAVASLLPNYLEKPLSRTEALSLADMAVRNIEEKSAREVGWCLVLVVASAILAADPQELDRITGLISGQLP